MKKVSLLIPSYNYPEGLERVVKSIIALNYRPIEICIIDDCSPDFELRSVVSSIGTYHEDGLEIKFQRNQTNIGALDSLLQCYHMSTGTYILPSAHDLNYTDTTFLDRAIRILSESQNCYQYVANHMDGSEQALSLDRSSLFSKFTKDKSIHIVQGESYSKTMGLKSWPGYVGWSQVNLMKREVLDKYKLLYPPFAVDRTTASELDLAPDNVQSHTFLLGFLGDVALDNNIVAFHEIRNASYSRSDHWGKVANEVNNFVYHNLMERFFTTVNDPQAFVDACFSYLDNTRLSRVNVKLLNHYTGARQALYIISIIESNGLNNEFNSIMLKLLKQNIRSMYVTVLSKTKLQENF